MEASASPPLGPSAEASHANPITVIRHAAAPTFLNNLLLRSLCIRGSDFFESFEELLIEIGEALRERDLAVVRNDGLLVAALDEPQIVTQPWRQSQLGGALPRQLANPLLPLLGSQIQCFEFLRRQLLE